MALALMLMEDTTSRYGADLATVMDPRAEGEFEVRTVTDLEQAEIDRWHKSNPNPAPGVKPYVVFVGPGSGLEAAGGDDSHHDGQADDEADGKDEGT